MHFSTAIVGTGVGGIFDVLALEEQNYKGTIGMFEQGKSRSISDLEIPELVGVGWGGAGGASDGKLNLSRGQGGQLSSLIEEDLLYDDLAELVLQKYVSFGGTIEDRTITGDEGKKLISKAADEGMVLLPSNIVHFGTDTCATIVGNMYNHLRDNASIFLKTRIDSVVRESDRFLLMAGEERYYADNVVLAGGRGGNEWTAEQCRNMELGISKSNGADIGVRVEEPNETLIELVREFYEAKIKCNTSNGLGVRTFCMCPSGYVINEDGKPNGHSWKYRKSGNTNVALLVTLKGTKEPSKYLKDWVLKPQEIYGRPIILETYGDFKNGISDPALPDNNKVQPTLPEKYWAVGNIHRVLPQEVCEALIETIENIRHIAPGFNADSTLLYGNEGKYYTLRIDIGVDLTTKVPGLFVVGDGSGWTRGLFQSSAMGWLVGSYIANNRPA